MRAPFLMSKALYLPSAQDLPVCWQLQACMLEFTHRAILNMHIQCQRPPLGDTDTRLPSPTQIKATVIVWQNDSWGVFMTTERTRSYAATLPVHEQIHRLFPGLLEWTAWASLRVSFQLCPADFFLSYSISSDCVRWVTPMLISQKMMSLCCDITWSQVATGKLPVRAAHSV